MKRVIPCLLLEDDGLVKTVRFRKPTYVGDPINTVRIFNEKEVDELLFLDITATRKGTGPDYSLLQRLVNESFMPLAYGGGIETVEQAARLFSMGVEKVAINSAFHERPELVREISDTYGAQAVIVALDVRKDWRGRQCVYARRGRKKLKGGVEEHARKAEAFGAGEIFLNDIDRDGTMTGYDIDLVAGVAGAVGVPVICCGGAASVEDLKSAVEANASAVAAGSMFVFHGPHKAVLISYPDREQLKDIRSGQRR